MLSIIFGLIFLCLCLQAALKDTMTLTIPNWMNIAIAALFFPAALFTGIGWTGFGLHLLTGFIAFVLCFGLFSVRVFGGGDAKMIPAVLLWIGPAGVLNFGLAMAIVGGLLGLALLFGRKAIPAHIVPGFAGQIMNPENGIPYGVAIAAGAVFAAPQSILLLDLVQWINVAG